MPDFRIGLFYPSTTTMHCSSTLLKGRNPSVRDVVSHVAVARATEQAGMDYMFLAEAWGARGPASIEVESGDPWIIGPTLTGALVAVTQNIKIVTTMHQAWWHPLQIARLGASLDNLSGGRWGMNAVTGAGFAQELWESFNPSVDHDRMYESATESMEIVLQAWHNDGNVDFQGDHYQVKGRLVGPMPVQDPHPLIISAGSSAAGCEFAGRYASVSFIPGRTKADVIEQRREQVREASKRAGRETDKIKVYLHASVIIGEDEEDAQRLSDELLATIDLRSAYEMVGTTGKTSNTYDDLFKDHTEAELAQIGLAHGTMKLHGSPEQVAQGIATLQRETGCDGLSLSFVYWSPEHIERFGARVAPLLEEMDVWSPAVNRNWAW
jgi:FMNH2-dependent dimethyl sulfone monooxygenase